MDENLNKSPLENEEETLNNENVVDNQQEAPEEQEEYIPDWARDDVVETEEPVEGESYEDEVVENQPIYEQQQSFEVEPKKKKSKTGLVVGIIIGVIVIAIAALGYIYLSGRNPYNEMGYVNVSGRTIKDVAAEAGFATVDEFLAEYGLPQDMPEDTHEAAAFYCIPLRKMTEMYGFESVDALKEAFLLGDDVNENTPWGEAEGKITLSVYVGDENLEQFKAEYGLDESVTGETTWGEVRNTVEQKSYEMQMQAQAEAQAQAEEMNAQAEAETEAEGEAEAETEAAAEPEAESASAE